MMRVYINWETQEVVGGHQADDVIDRKVSEYLEDEELLEEYLYERFSLSTIWNMDTKRKEEIFEEYTAYQKEQAEDWFDDEFCEYLVE
jgi:hypothetical protein